MTKLKKPVGAYLIWGAVIVAAFFITSWTLYIWVV